MSHCGPLQILTKHENKTTFNTELHKVLKHLKQTCMRRGVAKIDPDYVRVNTKGKATVLCWFPESEACGFALGHERNAQVFFVDLLCTQKKQGRRLLKEMEAYAREREIPLVALRAASEALVPVYEERGYARVADACVPPSKIDKKLRRKLERKLKTLDEEGLEKKDRGDLYLHGAWMSKCV